MNLFKALWEEYKKISIPAVLVPPPPKKGVPLKHKENTMAPRTEIKRVSKFPRITEEVSLSPLALYNAIGELAKQVENINMAVQHLVKEVDVKHLRGTDAKTKA